MLKAKRSATPSFSQSSFQTLMSMELVVVWVLGTLPMKVNLRCGTDRYGLVRDDTMIIQLPIHIAIKNMY